MESFVKNILIGLICFFGAIDTWKKLIAVDRPNESLQWLYVELYRISLFGWLNGEF